MKKRIFVLLVVVLLMALTIQVAFADPPAEDPDNYGSCHMIASWWAPLPGGGPAPGNAYGVEYGVYDPENDINYPDVQRRGMAMAHYSGNPEIYTPGAKNMDKITIAHCGG